MTVKKLYKKDRIGNTRVWWMEYDDEKYRTCSGILNGAIVESGWVYPSQKNVGKSNETSVKAQVLSEIESQYDYQLVQGKYHESIDTIDNGASYVECQLAEKYNPEKMNNFPYIVQPKFNGARALGVDEWTLQTRKGKRHVSCPHILEDIAEFQDKFPDYILDGELYNHELKYDFEELMSLIRKSKNVDAEHVNKTRNKVFFYVYDVITPEPMAFEDRLKFLQDNVYGKYKYIRESETEIVNSHEEILEVLEKHLSLGYEGTMLRNPKSYYQGNRTNDLVKVKKFLDEEATVVDIIEGVGNWAGMAKAVTIKLDNGIIQDSGMRGNFEFAKNILDRKSELIGTKVTITYPEKTKVGKIKFPIVTYWWGGERDV